MQRNIENAANLTDIINPDSNLFELVQQQLQNYNPHSHRCERCGREYWFVRKVITYSRSFVWVYNGEPKYDTIEIPVMLCENCGKSADGTGNKDGNYYHAILISPFIIPFSRYTLSFILAVLDAYVNRTCTIIQFCSNWKIAVSTLYDWKKRYKEHYDAWSESIKSIRMKEQEELNSGSDPVKAEDKAIAYSLNRISTFLTTLVVNFFKRFSFSFMQSNRKTHLREVALKRRLIF